MGTLRVVLKRLLAALPNLAGVVVITFLLTRALPGDPAAYFAGGAATQEAIDQVRRQLGLDRTLPEQFLLYVGGLLKGDFGLSITTGQPVLQGHEGALCLQVGREVIAHGLHLLRRSR